MEWIWRFILANPEKKNIFHLHEIYLLFSSFWWFKHFKFKLKYMNFHEIFILINTQILTRNSYEISCDEYRGVKKGVRVITRIHDGLEDSRNLVGVWEKLWACIMKADGKIGDWIKIVIKFSTEIHTISNVYGFFQSYKRLCITNNNKDKSICIDSLEFIIGLFLIRFSKHTYTSLQLTYQYDNDLWEDQLWEATIWTNIICHLSLDDIIIIRYLYRHDSFANRFVGFSRQFSGIN